MDAKTLWKKSAARAAKSPGNLISGAVSLAASAALWNPLPVILWGLGSGGWVLFASTDKGYHKKILDEERQAKEARIEAERVALEQKVSGLLLEPPVAGWIRRGLLPDYMQAYRQLVNIRDRVARVFRERSEVEPVTEEGFLQQLNYMLSAYLHFVRERLGYLQILIHLKPGGDAAPAKAGAQPPPPPPPGFAPNRWERVKTPARQSQGQGQQQEPSPAAPPKIDSLLEEIDGKVTRLLELAKKEPATARTREWHISILEKQRELLLECQKRDQMVVAQLGAFADVFQVILGRVSASQFSATEIASYMGSVVEQIEETERFVDSLRPAMDELMVGMDTDLRPASP
ncbi:MAG TPA: hypothetical protein VF756_23385 [Thermoanaerobaculia bacterium]